MITSAKNQIEAWSHDKPGEPLYIDPGMTSMKLADAADHLEVALLLQAGKKKEAGALAMGLDTASREEIPNNAYQYLYKSW